MKSNLALIIAFAAAAIALPAPKAAPYDIREPSNSRLTVDTPPSMVSIQNPKNQHNATETTTTSPDAASTEPDERKKRPSIWTLTAKKLRIHEHTEMTEEESQYLADMSWAQTFLFWGFVVFAALFLLSIALPFVLVTGAAVVAVLTLGYLMLLAILWHLVFYQRLPTFLSGEEGDDPDDEKDSVHDEA